MSCLLCEDFGQGHNRVVNTYINGIIENSNKIIESTKIPTNKMMKMVYPTKVGGKYSDICEQRLKKMC